MKANYQMQWLAFVAFGCDKINVSLLKIFELNVCGAYSN